MFRQELLAEAELAGEEIETPEPSEAGDDNDDVDDDPLVTLSDRLAVGGHRAR